MGNTTEISGVESGKGPVCYWMHRDHRIRDNRGLFRAAKIAHEQGVPLFVVYCLVPRFSDETIRQVGFLLRGLAEVEATLARVFQGSVPFVLLRGEPHEELTRFVREQNVSAVVTDFDPLRSKRQQVDFVSRAVSCPVQVIDSRNLVPCLTVSEKREYAARTLRPKIHRMMDAFLHEDLSALPRPVTAGVSVSAVDWDAVYETVVVDRSVPEVSWLNPGESGARATLQSFIAERLPLYDKRNDPTVEALSHLSPYLHFGMISSREAVSAVMPQQHVPQELRESFVEEIIVRRELADNFCWHTHDYDKVTCFPEWAQKTLDAHRCDVREYVYSPEQFEGAQTHDPLWNAAQTELVSTGKMHGYMRMYWGKKILEWTASPEDAMQIAVHLNDRYALDGRESNGYAGIAWSIGGVHDRPWKERSVFGSIRYMNYAGAKRKFDVVAYCAKYAATPKQASLFS